MEGRLLGVETGGAGTTVAALAAVRAVMRSTEGANGNGSATVLGRLCESISRNLGFERAAIARWVDERHAIEIVAAHNWPADELARLVTAVGFVPAVQHAGATCRAVSTRALGSDTGVVTPLLTDGRCVGFLFGDGGSGSPELDSVEHDVLATTAVVAAAALETAFVQADTASQSRIQAEFVALASHELRTPVAAMCGLAATLHVRADTLADEQRTALIRVLHEQGQRLQQLVEQLLDLSRLEAPTLRIAPAPIAVRARTEDIVQATAGDRADEIELRIEDTLSTTADPQAFDRIVSNLVANALRYGKRPIVIAASLEDPHFRLVVEDRGPGISAAFLPTLFDRFTRDEGSTATGSGLGLSIARAYAQAHGGHLVYNDAKPSGARFELIIPIAVVT